MLLKKKNVINRIYFIIIVATFRLHAQQYGTLEDSYDYFAVTEQLFGIFPKVECSLGDNLLKNIIAVSPSLMLSYSNETAPDITLNAEISYSGLPEDLLEMSGMRYSIYFSPWWGDNISSILSNGIRVEYINYMSRAVLETGGYLVNEEKVELKYTINQSYLGVGYQFQIFPPYTEKIMRMFIPYNLYYQLLFVLHRDKIPSDIPKYFSVNSSSMGWEADFSFFGIGIGGGYFPAIKFRNSEYSWRDPQVAGGWTGYLNYSFAYLFQFILKQ